MKMWTSLTQAIPTEVIILIAVIGIIVVAAIIYKLNSSSTYYEYVDDDGKFTAECRQNVVDMIVNQFCLINQVSAEDISIRVDSTSPESNLVTFMHEKYEFFVYCRWDKEKVRIIAKYRGDDTYTTEKTFKIKSNLIDVNQLEVFYQDFKLKTADLEFTSDKMSEIVAAANFFAEQKTNEEAKELLFQIPEDWVWYLGSKKFKTQKALYFKLMTFILHNYKEEYMAYLKGRVEAKEKTARKDDKSEEEVE